MPPSPLPQGPLPGGPPAWKKAAEEGEVVELTRYDKPVAVLISYGEYESKKSKGGDWLFEWRKEYADVLDDVGFDITPSRECPDYAKDPWA